MAKNDIVSALQSLKPGAQWVLRGSDLSGLEWVDSANGGSAGPRPSDSAINNEIIRLDNAEPMKLLRVERDAKLAALDWEVTRAYSKGVAVDTALKNHMQALRDLPASASPKCDSSGSLIGSSVTWPTR